MADGDKKNQRWEGKIWADEHRGTAKEASCERNRDGAETSKMRGNEGNEEEKLEMGESRYFLDIF